jgi:hypothetical protein
MDTHEESFTGRIGFYGCFYGCLTVLRTWINFTDFYRKLYGHGIQSFLLCVLSVAMSAPYDPTAGYSMALSLYAALPITLTIVHFDDTPILSLHTIPLSDRAVTYYLTSCGVTAKSALKPCMKAGRV